MTHFPSNLPLALPVLWWRDFWSRFTVLRPQFTVQMKMVKGDTWLLNVGKCDAIFLPVPTVLLYSNESKSFQHMTHKAQIHSGTHHISDVLRGPTISWSFQTKMWGHMKPQEVPYWLFSFSPGSLRAWHHWGISPRLSVIFAISHTHTQSSRVLSRPQGL